MTPWKKWFVHDWNEGFQIFETEQEAKDLFKKILDQYADEASEDEWNMEVEHLCMGEVLREVKIKEIPHEMDEDDDSDPYPDGLWDAEIVELQEEKQ